MGKTSILNRRNFLVGSSVVVLSGFGATYYMLNKRAPLGFEPTQSLIQRGEEFLSKNISIDIHAHPGRSFVAGAHGLDLQMKVYAATSLFEERAIADMRKGGLTVASFATVSDFQVLGLSEKGIASSREFTPGEAWQSYQDQRDRIVSFSKREGMRLIRSSGDVISAKNEKQLGILFTAEGGDFLEGNLDRLEACYADGLRSITLVHYHINEIGDIQTAPAKHNGLTDFGSALVQSMNSLGIVIDLAHASKQTAIDALELSEKPVVVSHAGINRSEFSHPRFIDLDLAKKVTEKGGVIGAWPAGLGLTSLSDYIDQILYLVDAVGEDHVSIGSDMDANYKPVYDNFDSLPLIAGMLLDRGMGEAGTAKVLGRNYLRVMKTVEHV